jgi:hypothetical protein
MISKSLSIGVCFISAHEDTHFSQRVQGFRWNSGTMKIHFSLSRWRPATSLAEAERVGGPAPLCTHQRMRDAARRQVRVDIILDDFLLTIFSPQGGEECILEHVWLVTPPQ